MKKSLIYSLFLSFLFSLMFISEVNALDMYLLDQEQLTPTGSAPIYSEYKTNQTFRVTKNVLTKVAIGMEDRKPGAGITLTIKDENTGKTVATKTQRMSDVGVWEIFNLTGNGVGYSVNVTHRFSMWVSCNLYEDYTPAWYFTTDSDSYTRGFRRGNLLDLGGDHVFKTYGYDLVLEEPELPTEQPSEEEVVPPVVPSVIEDQVVEDNTSETPVTDSVPSDESQPLFVASDKDVDESISAPTLEELLVNDKNQDYEDTVSIKSGDILKISGTADIEGVVAIMIDDKIYTVFSDNEGKWNLTVDSTGFIEGEYTVMAQFKNSKGDVSNKVEFFKLDITVVQDSVLNTDNEQEDKLLYIFLIGLSVVFFALVGMSIYFIVKKTKNSKINISEKDKNMETPTTSQSEIEREDK